MNDANSAVSTPAGLFEYELPDELIARYPAGRRTDSRLLKLERDGMTRDLRFGDLPGLLRPHDLLILNDTRVLPARLFGRKPTGGRVELLLERLLDASRALFQTHASKPLRAGQRLWIESPDGNKAVEVVERREAFTLIRALDPPGIAELLETAGHVPLPPYLKRADEELDRERYQTVYARHDGAVAAPTAGLHFDAGLLEQLEAHGVRSAFLTLHVGAGTFAPVRAADPNLHRMHAERCTVPADTVEAVKQTRLRGGRVIAVGTTVVRALETAAAAGALAPYHGETDIFIHSGFVFRVVDALLTNFHLPGSTLLMLVCAFAGTERVMAAYRHAVAAGYRFYSYGDAMFVEQGTSGKLPGSSKS
jgi:S-adenosylmethionine:tRNA ribosyltransferase-isomerase